MIESVDITVDGKKLTVASGSKYEDVVKKFENNYEFPIILVKVNKRIHELSRVVKEGDVVECLDLTTTAGNTAHINGLVFVLISAIKKLYGNKYDVVVLHSQDKGLYISTTCSINDEKVKLIKKEMQKIIDNDLNIEKLTVDRMEAIKYFEDMEDYSKAGIIRYMTNNFVTLYRMDNLYNYFYSYMVVSTRYLKDFDITYVKNNELILQFPTVYNKQISKYVHHEQMLEVFEQTAKWGEIVKVENAYDLNNYIASGKISELIMMNELVTNSKIYELAKKIINSKAKIILMAGPSSSGKTTTSKKISLALKSYGMNSKVIAMDDYFVDRTETPIGPDGEPDFECMEALDLKLFDKQIGELLDGKEVLIPTFNFVTGSKEYKDLIKLDKNEVLIIEGIHGLDDAILTNIKREDKFKIYISPLTELNIDGHNRISTSDNRLMRRIIRDNRTRNYNVTHTLASWKKVRQGEEQYIFPYQDSADVIMNTALIYEFGVLKTYVEPLLYAVPDTSDYYEDAKRLINVLKLFLPISPDDIPKDSILREFIGGSCFHA